MKKQYRIGHIAKELNVKRFVIRFWEREFGLSSPRSTGGQRCYEQGDIDRFKQIKQLLYDQGFTIAGAKKWLEEHAAQPVAPLTGSAQEITFIPAQEKPSELPEAISEQITTLHRKLLKLREML
ncbi:MAG TPA: MerR family transcriptional regulator [Candidatus Babeliales bacterium]|nr:MerR family transcriptional regulator [Candidatus Babeliales bacterium]